ncbi:transmembrane protein, putative (macronuclear) [Tetrahymena thermophila SB210]|uniref:Transmembrane protein, putative n=1 Tax=Tetrahymena thermophila (strain SB210) TaxID=312017 RepID=W7X466_TETTS|nr:transmembrane protein, putative [Tetrahymena thermophila SB210]EWS71203.1 transmembrane protein, putative [Tetrahymena thermophila SB210]|eukprot:XP_012656256.1 transmembrane protein, putative [Tetrahymena thermophila SB210]
MGGHFTLLCNLQTLQCPYNYNKVLYLILANITLGFVFQAAAKMLILLKYFLINVQSSFSLSNISSHRFTGPADIQSVFNLYRIEIYSNNYIAIATDYGYFDDNCFVQVSPQSKTKNCLLCKPNYVQKNYECIPYDKNDICQNSQNPQSYYFYYKQFNQCIQVNNPIKYCAQLNSTYLNQCEVCVSTTRDPNNQCQCYPQYYESNQQDCKPIDCNSVCKQCKYNPNNCTECWEPTRDVSKNCQCKDGFYEDNLSSKCLPCDPKCKTQCNSECSKCINYSSNCIECAINRINYPKCQCQVGYKENLLGECVPNQIGCNEDCEICDSVTPSICIQCKSSEQSGTQCLCQDKNNKQMVCSNCDPSCLTCSGGQNNECLSCSYKQELNSQKQCQCQDQNNFINQNGLCEEGFDINDVTLQSDLQVTFTFSEEINVQDLSLLNQGIKLYLTQVSSTNFNQEIVSASKNQIIMKITQLLEMSKKQNSQSLNINLKVTILKQVL